MAKRPHKKTSHAGEFDENENEPRLNHEPQRPSSLPEIEFVSGIGSTTGVMRIRLEDDDKTTQGDEDNPL